MINLKPLFYKEFLLSKRNLPNLFISIGMPLAFFLLFSSLWTSDPSMTKEQVFLFTRRYLFSMSAFSSLSFVLFNLPYNIQQDRLENRLRMLRFSSVSNTAYFLVKIIRTLIYFGLSITIICFVGYFFRGIHLQAQDWLLEGLYLILGAASFMPFGLLLSYAKSSETLSIISNIFYMGLAILGGLWFPVELFPKWMQTLSKFTPTYHFSEILTEHFNHRFPVSSAFVLLLYSVIISIILVIVAKKHSIRTN